MHQLKEVLARLRAGEPERAIARSGAVGRDKLASLRTVADQNGWLDLRNPLPSEAEMAAVLGQHKCIDPAESAHLTPLKHMPERAFSS
ncbi:MAG: hypothetical protein R3E83_19365 [Burkholderiaceae bacterium]